MAELSLNPGLRCLGIWVHNNSAIIIVLASFGATSWFVGAHCTSLKRDISEEALLRGQMEEKLRTEAAILKEQLHTEAALRKDLEKRFDLMVDARLFNR